MTEFSKDERNNRQIILWGKEGQESVDNARIVVLGSDCVVSEFLKNIVLHGFGNVTIIDDAIVNKEDIMSNFLVDANDLGKPRAESVANLLRELNEEIKVEAKNQSPLDLSFIKQEPKPGFIITCGNLKPSFLVELNKLCRENGIPQGHIQSVGLFGAFYLDAGLHSIFEGPYFDKNPFFELRASNPFPELEEYFKSFKFQDKSAGDLYDHIPSPVIFNKAYTELKSEDKLPAQLWKQAPVINGRVFELQYGNLRSSFNEAKSKVYDFLKPPVPQNVQEVLKVGAEHPEIKTPFWQLVRATKRFCDAHNALPHYGGCPDLETSTPVYLHLKKLYEEQSKKDWAEIRKYLTEDNANVDEDTFTRFLKNVFKISYVDFKPITEAINFIKNGDNEYGVSTVQCLFVAIRNFYEEKGEQPKNTKEDQDALIAKIKEIGGNKVGNDEEIANYVKEFCVSQNHIIPSVAATIGAIFAEEVTKIVINQSKPINGAFIYNAVTCSGSPYTP